MAIVLDVSLPARELDVIVPMDDPFVPVLALCAEEHGRIVEGRLDKDRWEEIAADEGLDGSHWLLAYEGSGRGWLADDIARKLDEHQVFGWFRENDVSFFDGKASVVGLNRWSRYGEPPDSGPETDTAQDAAWEDLL